jgi:hypothetical protein
MGRAEFDCPGCSQRLTAGEQALKGNVRCPRCALVVRPLDVIALDAPLPAIPVDDSPGKPRVTEDVKSPGPSRYEVMAAEPVGEKTDDASVPAAADPDPPPGGGREIDSAAKPEPALRTNAKRGKGGTLVMEEAVRPAPRLQASASVVDELAGIARHLVDAIDDRLGRARARIVLIATPSVALPLLVLLAFAGPSLLRSIVSAVVAALAWAMVVVAAALRLARRPSPSRRTSPRAHALAAAAVAIAACLAIGFTGLVAGIFASGDGAAAPATVASAPPTLPAATPTGYAAGEQAASSTAVVSGADAELRRDGADTVLDAQLFVPKSFHSDDGAFDLVIHLNAQPGVVLQSIAGAGVNALVVVVNLERGDKYHKRFADPGAYMALLEAVRTQAEKRGLRAASLRRVALSAFGAGSGALTRILGVEKNLDTVDAVIVLEGIQVRWVNEKRERVDPNEIAPYVRFAHLAAEGKKLFCITHGQSGGDEDRAPAHAAADAILEDVAAKRSAMNEPPPAVELEGAARLFQDGVVHGLEPDSASNLQGLHVLGYKNKAPGQQVAQLVQMSVTALPFLAERWK